jgi:hypothetical protein
MPLFRSQKQPAPLLPSDISQKMVLYGRYEFSPQQADQSVVRMVSQLLPELYPKAAADPDNFISELAAAVLPHGGWAVYGGERLVRDLIGTESRHPGFLQMIDVAMRFLRSLGYGPQYMAPYEMAIWNELHPRNPS